ncbi:MAG TPA: histidine kinase [Candidatus Dormibacteraeota bacterium]|nr:histidine kinase [Candidatus Dormibacteraeota bacterium]
MLTLAETLPVAWRRRFPWPVLAFTGSAAAALTLIGGPSTDIGVLGVLVAYYTVAARASRRFAIGLGAATAGGILLAKPFEPTTVVRIDDLVLIYAQFAAAWVLADNARWRRQHNADLEDLAAARERARIARELHDGIADSLGVIMVQAGAARSAAGGVPERVDACLRSIESVSREAWTELRHVLALERGGNGGPALPGLRHLERLVGQFAAAGLVVDLVVSGNARPLPAAADRCAYRVVQEALTNALRHSGTARADVRIHYASGCLQVDVANDDPEWRGEDAASDGGHGLRGMRERLEQIGGELYVRSGERFTVEARLPIPPADS